MQMWRGRAARGIASKLDGFLNIDTNQASGFSKPFGKEQDLAPALALQLSSNLSRQRLQTRAVLRVERPIQRPLSPWNFGFIPNSEVQWEKPLFPACGFGSSRARKRIESQGKGELSKISNLIFKPKICANTPRRAA